MNLLVNFKTALKAIFKNKKRSFLTMIGIIIGVGAVITIMAIGRGFEKKTLQELTNSKEGEAVIEVNYEQDEETPYDENISPFTKDDEELISQVTGVKKVKPQTFDEDTSINTQISGNGKSENYMGSLDLKKDRNILYGRKIKPAENDLETPIAMVDEDLAKKLFGSGKEAIGHGLDINGFLFTIVGVFEGEGTDSMFSFAEDQFVVPKKIYRKYFPVAPYVYQMQVVLKNGFKPNEVTDDVLKTLNAEGSQASKGKYTVFDSSFLTDGISNVMGSITTFISAIAGISLFIAGVGVMNMMYISVSERTREIGIRRALGATQRSIMMQFLIEGLTLTVTGGIIGYLLGMMIAWIFGKILSIPISIDLFTISLAIGLSSLTGLVFSVFPAKQAAKKDVVEILR